jgi:hypothetical protein
MAIEELHGKDGLDRVREAMPARLREQIMLVRPLDWYPVEVTAALHASIRDVLGGGSWDESQRISRVAAKKDLTGPYRALLRAVQYDTVWDRMERVWRQYYDAGEARWVERGHGHAKAEFTGVAGFNVGMWRTIAGRVELMLEMTGARSPDVAVKEAASTHGTLEALWFE